MIPKKFTERQKLMNRQFIVLTKLISTEFQIPWCYVSKKRGERNINDIKHACFYIMYNEIGFSSKEIAYFFDTDHTTVLRSKQKIQNFIDIKDPLAVKIDNVTKKLNEHYSKA
jgi:chromosomal replication initiation ATPase DnaA